MDAVPDPLQPDFIVNTDAMRHVEKCVANPSAAFPVSGIGAMNIASWGKPKQCHRPLREHGLRV